MGMDIEIWSKGFLKPEDHEEFKRRVREHGFYDYIEQIVSKTHGPVVNCYSLCRYYGPAYERGDWIAISAMIETMRAIYGNVYYHSDSIAESEITTEFTIEDSNKMWEYWRSGNWENYRKD